MLKTGRARLRRFLKFGCLTLLVPTAATALYFLAAVLLALIPANRTAEFVEDGVEILLDSNGLHVELVLPVRAQGFDWNDFLRADDFGEPIAAYKSLGFGWGERRFLLETPFWSDLKLSVAVPATLWPTPAAMRVTLFGGVLLPGQRVRRAVIPRETYAMLVRYIRDSFQLDPAGRPILIGRDRTGQDNSIFYEATGSYHALRTCNVWTNNALKQCGLRTATWAPCEESIFRYFPEPE